jgi:hypothetical protein
MDILYYPSNNSSGIERLDAVDYQAYSFLMSAYEDGDLI